MMTDLRKLAKESLEIQDACNLCGLANRFAVVMRELQFLGTDGANTHPITKMWISKFEHLAGLEQSMTPYDYRKLCELADD